MDHGQRSARIGLGLPRALFAGCLLFSFLLPPDAPADTPAVKPLRPVPIQAAVSMPPVVFRGSGQRHLAYEIQMTNWSDAVWTIHRIDVRGEDGVPLLEVDGKGLGDVVWHPSRKPDDKSGDIGALAPGESVVAYMWIDLAESAMVPARLRNRLTATQAGDETLQELDAPTTPVMTRPIEISPPLAGTNWLAVNAPSNSSPHRRARIIIDGVPYISQRYAIDWVKVGEDLQSHHGNPEDNRNYLCFGQDALAAADGVVVEVKDGIPENVPQAPPVVPITLETIAGNHLLLDFGGGVYAMYAHLQPGSLRVKLGDKVHRGQVLGLVGNTGNSGEPHLHFQLMDRASPLGAEGVPYTLPGFVVTRRVAGDFEHPSAVPLAAPEIHRGELPLDMQLVNFE